MSLNFGSVQMGATGYKGCAIHEHRDAPLSFGFTAVTNDNMIIKYGLRLPTVAGTLRWPSEPLATF